MAFDRYLQYQDRQDASRMVGMVEEETRQKRQELLLRYKDAPALFSCIVREEYSKMGVSQQPHPPQFLMLPSHYFLTNNYSLTLRSAHRCYEQQQIAWPLRTR